MIISFASSSVHLRDRDRFKNYFQIYASESNYIPGIASIMTFYGWSRVVIITEKVTLFTETEETLFELLTTKSVNATRIDFESDDDPADIPNLFPENGRIFFLNMWEPKARQVICEHPYQFCTVKGGSFRVGKRYGSVKRSKFCLIAIVAEMSNGDTPSDSDDDYSTPPEGSDDEDGGTATDHSQVVGEANMNTSENIIEGANPQSEIYDIYIRYFEYTIF
uniref:Receptor ligand binding region domain-containing protein n=1 Tax=Amphimedon queenslandica TaxID=400682 RepID=A0A1X7SN43_AMPQE